MLGVTAAAAPLPAQQAQEQRDLIIGEATRAAVIDAVIARLHAAYVFPDKAAEVERALRERVRRKEYASVASAAAFANLITEHLQAVTRDRHLRLRYREQPIPERGPQAGPTPEQREERRRMTRRVNGGFERVERLIGNVGYLELLGFEDPESIEEIAAAAMTFLSGTDALIIDLRRNGGGHPGGVALVSSYLFGSDTVHLNSLYWRPENRTDHFWTRSAVKGVRYGPDKPVYVLTSRRTFSAAEEFSYNLQTLRRATIVGDTTGGGAHPGGAQRVHQHFMLFVPSGRAINPITKTNWEGTGVRPEVPVPSDRALGVAHAAALRKLIAAEADPQWKRNLERVLREVESGASATTAAGSPPR